jgi:hypothetical protein
MFPAFERSGRIDFANALAAYRSPYKQGLRKTSFELIFHPIVSGQWKRNSTNNHEKTQFIPHRHRPHQCRSGRVEAGG